MDPKFNRVVVDLFDLEAFESGIIEEYFRAMTDRRADSTDGNIRPSGCYRRG
jgi:hypothetical protein